MAQGRAQFSSLNDDQRAIAHALVDARIAELTHAASFGSVSHEGHGLSVGLDDDGTASETSEEER